MLAHKKENRPKSLEILKYLTNSQNLNNILKNGEKMDSFLIEEIKNMTLIKEKIGPDGFQIPE